MIRNKRQSQGKVGKESVTETVAIGVITLLLLAMIAIVGGS